MTERYAKSTKRLDAIEHIIPLGSQTFSKSRTQYPRGAAPLFANRSSGSKTWDIDDNCYIDLVSSLGAVTLGYGDAEIADAVSAQLLDGVTLSLAHPLEGEVAQLLVDLVPCAEMVRFGKNGTDATTAAIRLARAFTGHDYVIMCGYHGWQDWSIGTTSMNLGVPNLSQSLTRKIPFNDPDALQAVLAQLNGAVAAVVMEPMTNQWPSPGYLEWVREITYQQGIVLIFDETVTGFRLATGGAQELFGVTPDLACLGKALGNGFPLSAIVGSRSIMKLMDRVFFSGTFGGEVLSLAAARVVLRRYRNGGVTEALSSTGESLRATIKKALSPEAAAIFGLEGHPAWLFHKWELDGRPLAIAKTLLLQELLKRGVLVLATHNVTLAHDTQDIAEVATAYSQALQVVVEALNSPNPESWLDGPLIEPLFSIRN